MLLNEKHQSNYQSIFIVQDFIYSVQEVVAHFPLCIGISWYALSTNGPIQPIVFLCIDNNKFLLRAYMCI